MKKLFYFIALFIIFFSYSCQKDNYESTSSIEPSSQQNSFLSVNIECSGGQPRIRPTAANKTKQQNFITEFTSSPTFDWNSELSSLYGDPILVAGIYNENSSEQSMLVPVWNNITREVTSLTRISKSNGSFRYKFIDRKFHNYYKSKHNDLGTRYFEHFFQLFDYSLCKTDILPQSLLEDEGPVGNEGDGIVYMEDCYTVETQTYIRECTVLKGPEIAGPRWDCEVEVTEIHLTSVPCPGSGGTGGGGGGTGGGGGGNTTGGGSGTGGSGNGTGINTGTNNNGPTNNSLSESQFKAAVKATVLALCQLSPQSCGNANLLVQRDCGGTVNKLTKYLGDNNFSPIASCIIENKLNELVAQTQSNSSACGQNLNLPNLGSINASINSNLQQQAANAYPELNTVLWQLSNTSLIPVVRKRLSDAINEYLQPVFNNPNVPTGGSSNGSLSIPSGMLANIQKLNSLIINHYPNISDTEVLDQSIMTWMMNNTTQLDIINNHISSFQSNSSVPREQSNYNLARSLSLTYAKIAKEEGINTLQLDSGNPNDPIYGIMKEMLVEAIKEQIIDIIPGASLASIGPQVFGNIQDGQWLTAMQGAMEIVMNEGDVFFPALKVASAAVGMAVSAKQIKKVFDALDNIRINNFPTQFITKLYNTFRTKMNWGVDKIRQNFSWIDNTNGAKLENISGEDFLIKLKEEFSFNACPFTSPKPNSSLTFPVFELLIPNSNSSVYVVGYPDSNTGYQYTLQF